MPKYHDGQLRQEINIVLDRLQTNGEAMRPQWVAHEVCDSHRRGLVNDSESIDVAFWTYTGYFAARKLATQCINDRDASVSGQERLQPLLPYDGFSRTELQDYYVVTRDDEDIAVPTRDLTDEEIHQKIALYRRNAYRLNAHADELERYKEWRRAA